MKEVQIEQDEVCPVQNENGHKKNADILMLAKKDSVQQKEPVVKSAFFEAVVKIGSLQSQPVVPIRRAHPLGDVIESHDSTAAPLLLMPGVKEGSVGFVFGVPKSGKTTYLENLLMTIAAGRTTFNGYPLECTSRVCLGVSFEEYTRNRTERNKMQLKSFTQIEQLMIRQRYIVSNQQMPKYLLTSKDWQAMKDEIAYYRPGVVMIDSLSRLTLDNNGDEEIAKRIMKELKEMAETYNCTVLIINHTPKGAGERQLSISSMSGSRIFMQEADFLIGINRTINNTRYIKLVCSRYDKDDYETVDKFIIDDNLCIQITGKVSEADTVSENDGRVDNSNADIVLEAISSAASEKEDGVVLIDDIKHLFEGEDIRMTGPTFYAAIRKLEAKEAVKKKGKGKYQLGVA